MQHIYMAQYLNLSLLLLLVSLSHLFNLTDAVLYDITKFGAKSDGKSDSSQAFLNAFAAACSSSGPTTVHVPSGNFLIGHVRFSGPCKSSDITIQIDGTLTSPSDYNGFGKKGDWIVFDNVQGVSVHGGTIDGRGASLWSCKAQGHHSCPYGSTSLTFLNSKDIMISGLTSINSELYHIVIDRCQGVTVQGVKISAPGNSPNTDGIHVQMSNDVTITEIGIRTGDDCISIGPGTTNLRIEQVNCGPGHGISIGSLGKEYQEPGVQNVTVKTTVFTGTENGLRIKTWARPSKGFVKGVVFEHALMQNVENPIIIDQNYCPDDKGCPDKSSGVRISDVTYVDIHGTSASQVAVNFDCSTSNPCSGIEMQDIKLTHGGKIAASSCKHADGSASGIVEPNSCL